MNTKHILALTLGGLLLAGCAGPTDALEAAIGPTPTLKPIVPAVIPGGWKTHSSSTIGFSIAYPSDWQANEQNLVAEFDTPEMLATQRGQGAALLVTATPGQDALSLQDIWNNIKPGLADNSPTEPVSITLGGQDALRAEISNAGKAMRGVMIVSKRGPTYFLVVMYTLKQNDPAKYDAIFKDMLASFRFTK